MVLRHAETIENTMYNSHAAEEGVTIKKRKNIQKNRATKKRAHDHKPSISASRSTSL